MATSRRWSIDVLSAGFEKNAALLRAIRGWRGETASDGREAPFLDVGLDEDETRLTKVNVDGGWAVCTNCREEVL